MSEWQQIAKRSDLTEGKLTVDFQGTEVTIFHVGEEFFAIDDLCPHQGAPLSTQGIINAPKKEVACSWHGWRFDLETGRSTNVPGYRTQTYEVKLEGEEIFLKEKASATLDKPKTEEMTEEDKALWDEVVAVVESDIRPAVQMDGGDIEIVAVHEGIVKVKLHGACTTCSSSSVTLYQGVSNILGNKVPGVRGVEQVF